MDTGGVWQLFCSTSVVLACTLGACSSAGTSSAGSDCASPGKCPHNEAKTQDEIAKCNATLSGACGSQYKALRDCFATNQKCLPDGNTDGTATYMLCKAQNDSFTTCVPVGDAGGGGG